MGLFAVHIFFYFLAYRLPLFRMTYDIIYEQTLISEDSPSLGKVCPVCHHLFAQLCLVVSVGHRGGAAQRISKHISNLISMHHPSPAWPGRVLCAMSELIQKQPDQEQEFRNHNFFCIFTYFLLPELRAKY